MKRDFLENLGLDSRAIELILVECERRQQELAAEREELAAKLEDASKRCALLENEIEKLKTEGGFDIAKKAFDMALEALLAEYERSLARRKSEFDESLKAVEAKLQKKREEEKARFEKALAEAEQEAQKRLDEALAAQKAEFEKERLRAQIEHIFTKAGFGSTLALEAAVERFIADGGTPETAGEWLTKLREIEPSVFMQHSPPKDMPHFTVETPPSEDGVLPGGGLLSSMLKNLR